MNATASKAMIEWTPTTTADLNYKMNALDQVIQTYGEMISQTIRSARAYGERIVNPIQKGVFWDNFWQTRITPHINDSADEIERLIVSMREHLTQPTALVEGRIQKVAGLGLPEQGRW